MYSDKSSYHLWHLVQSLTRNEKGYFKKYSQKFSLDENKRYMLLFDALCKTKVYDENVLLSIWETPVSKNNFAVIKNYLFNQIIDSLLAFQQDANIDSQLGRYMLLIELMLKKNQTVLAYKYNNIAVKLARKYEKYYYLFALREKQLFLIDSVNLKPHLDDLYDNYYTTNNEFINYKNIVDLRNEYFRVRLLEKENLFRIKEKDKKEIYAILKKKIVNTKPKNNVSHFLLHYYFATNAVCYLVILESEKAFVFAQQNIDLWLASPLLVKEYYLEFLNVVKQYNNLCIKLKYSNKSEWLLKHPTVHSYTNKEQESKLKVHEWNVMIVEFYRSAQFSKCLLLLKEFDKKIDELEPYLSVPAKGTIYCNIMIANFIMGRYNEAFQCFHKTMELKSLDLRKDVIEFSMVFILLILFEMKNWNQLQYQANATYAYFYNKKSLGAFERTLINISKAIVKDETTKKRNETFFKSLKMLSEFKGKEDQPKIFKIFDFYAWLDYSAQGKTYRNHLEDLQKI